MFICLISQAKTSRILGASVYAVGVDNYDINEVNVFLVSLSQNFLSTHCQSNNQLFILLRFNNLSTSCVSVNFVVT